jgi:hypothetical protein
MKNTSFHGRKYPWKKREILSELNVVTMKMCQTVNTIFPHSGVDESIEQSGRDCDIAVCEC